MQTELLSQCLTAWMEQEGVSVAELKEMVGYKSKTSVFRLLKNQCNEQTREGFVELLAPHLDGEWEARFRKALRADRHGLHRCRLFDVILDCLHRPPQVGILCEESLLPGCGGTVYILGLPWKGIFRIVDSLVQKGFRVIHYMLRQQILDNPELLSTLMMHLLSLPYQAMLLEDEPACAWNVMATEGGQLFVNGNGSQLTGVRNCCRFFCRRTAFRCTGMTISIRAATISALWNRPTRWKAEARRFWPGRRPGSR